MTDSKFRYVVLTSGIILFITGLFMVDFLDFFNSRNFNHLFMPLFVIVISTMMIIKNKNKTN